MEPVTAAAREPSTNARLGSWRWFRGLPGPLQALVAALLSAALLGGFCAEENWRGRRAWEACSRALAARGVELNWDKFVPPPVPDSQNFAMTPFLAPLFDLNPLPLQPGQTRWRDAAGHARAVNFAARLLPSDKFGGVAPAGFDGQMLDLAEPARVLLGETNSAIPAAPATRPAAAAALLQALAQYEPVLDELRAASQRPCSHFNIQYDAEDPISILLPHYLVLQRVGRVLELRACAELALSQNSAALDDLKLLFFLSQSIRAEPFLITLRTRQNLLTAVGQVIWEALAQRRWSDSQLQAVQAELGRVNLLPDLSRALQAERAAFGDKAFRYIRTHKNVLREWLAEDPSAAPLTYLLAAPEGWLYQEQVVFQRLYQDRVLAGFDLNSSHLNPHAIDQNRLALAKDLSGSCLWHHTATARTLLDKDMMVFQNTALAQARVDLAVTACALERFRLAQNVYPQNLVALVPRFVAALAPDICTCQPLKYRLTDNRRFVLYEVGWNETDDGGIAPVGASNGLVPKVGDWVWPAYPGS